MPSIGKGGPGRSAPLPCGRCAAWKLVGGRSNPSVGLPGARGAPAGGPEAGRAATHSRTGIYVSCSARRRRVGGGTLRNRAAMSGKVSPGPMPSAFSQDHAVWRAPWSVWSPGDWRASRPWTLSSRSGGSSPASRSPALSPWVPTWFERSDSLCSTSPSTARSTQWVRPCSVRSRMSDCCLPKGILPSAASRIRTDRSTSR